MDNNYDLVFHLVGKQQIPNLLGIQNITSKKHIFIHTKEYNKTYCQQLLNLDYKFDTILVDAYNINNIKENIEKYLQNNQNKKWALQCMIYVINIMQMLIILIHKTENFYV